MPIVNLNLLLVTLLLLAGAPAMAAPQAAAAQAPCAACITLRVSPAQALALPARLDGLTVLVEATADAPEVTRAAVEDIRSRGGRAGVVLVGAPVQPVPPFVLGAGAIVLVDISTPPPGLTDDALAYALKTWLTATRAAGGADLLLGLDGGPRMDALVARDITPYIDFVVAPPERTVGATPAWRSMEAASAANALLATRRCEADRWVWSPGGDAMLAAQAMGDLARAAQWLPPGLVGPSTVEVRCGGAALETFLNPQTLETIALGACTPDTPIAVTPEEPGVERLALSSGLTLVRVPAPGAPDRFASGVDVGGARQLSVEEIIARHQAVAARQAAAIQTVVSEGTLTLTFEAPGFPAPITIAAETIMLVGGGATELAQRRITVNGIEFAGGGVPRLPIIEPERAAAPPLTITLTDLYRYRLAGTDDVDGRRCYVVAFEPAGEGLFRGRAWIAADSFALVKVAAVQTGLRGPIVSSEQVDVYAPTAGGWWLLARSDVRQVYEGAAHRTPIHRVLDLRRHDVNAADFAARRAALHASDAVMLRDTPAGYRYLRRATARDAPAAGGTGSAAATPAATRVVASRASRVRTLVGGVIIDPNISVPLPFAGLSYVDFDLFGTGAQLNAFFGGTYGQLAFSVPSLGGSRWQLAGRAFGIASSYNDRAFEDGREQYTRNIQQRPAHASVWLLRPLTARLSLRLGYDLDYTRFTAGELTAADFRVPANQVVHGARIALEGQRAGWNASAWWNPALRQGWRAWGRPGGPDYDPAHRGFHRYGIAVARSAVLTPRLTGRLEGAWMAGRDLDRFSRYAFGTFDNRLRGYPAALIRYDRGAVARGALAWSAARFLRADLFLDSARVRDPGFGGRSRSYTGVGAALEGPAPFGTLIAVEWGYGFRGVDADGGTGTHVIRVSAFKLF